MTNKELGTYLARKLFECGDLGSRRCTRIEFKLGKGPSAETSAGGFAEKPLAEFLTHTLDDIPK